MSKRMHDTSIWEEDWFAELPDQYKLFWLFIKDKCDHAGVWRVNKRPFTTAVPGKMLMLDDFLNTVNTKGEKPKQRVVVLDNGRWFLPGYISFQCGENIKFNVENGVHRGALRILIKNNIPLDKVPGIDFGFLYELSNEQLSEMAYVRGMVGVYYEYGRGMAGHKERDKEKDKDMKGVQGENKIETPQTVLYHKPFSDIARYFPSVKEVDFNKWKEFIDFIEKKGFQRLYEAKFVDVADWGILYNLSKFTEEKWEPVLRKILATGIKPEHELFFRIPEFMSYLKNGSTDKLNNLDTKAGNTNYENMDKW